MVERIVKGLLQDTLVEEVIGLVEKVVNKVDTEVVEEMGRVVTEEYVEVMEEMGRVVMEK